MKLNCKKIKEMIKDEDKGNKEYKKYRMNNLAKDEARHKRYLIKLKPKVCGR